MGCLYQIEFPNGKSYIGISNTNAEERWKKHCKTAKKFSDRCILQAIRKYGEVYAKIKTLVIANDWEYLCELERKAIAIYKTKAPFGYNMTDGGEGALGYRHTHESRIKIKIARSKQNITEETAIKISAANKGRKFTEEHKKKISCSNKGHTSWAKGRKFSKEHCEKIGNANRLRIWSDESRIKASISAKLRHKER